MSSQIENMKTSLRRLWYDIFTLHNSDYELVLMAEFILWSIKTIDKISNKNKHDKIGI